VHVDLKVQYNRESLSVELTEVFLTEERVHERVLVCDMKALSRFEDMEFVSGVWVGAKQGFEVEMRDTAFTLVGCQSAELFCCCCIRAAFMQLSGCFLWYCFTRSEKCNCSADSHVLSLSGYPFHFRRYCNCLEHP
jgi:hypothetical protein